VQTIANTAAMTFLMYVLAFVTLRLRRHAAHEVIQSRTVQRLAVACIDSPALLCVVAVGALPCLQSLGLRAEFRMLAAAFLVGIAIVAAFWSTLPAAEFLEHACESACCLPPC
jgi:hypothetical protein